MVPTNNKSTVAVGCLSHRKRLQLFQGLVRHISNPSATSGTSIDRERSGLTRYASTTETLRDKDPAPTTAWPPFTPSQGNEPPHPRRRRPPAAPEHIEPTHARHRARLVTHLHPGPIQRYLPCCVSQTVCLRPPARRAFPVAYNIAVTTACWDPLQLAHYPFGTEVRSVGSLYSDFVSSGARCSSAWRPLA